MSIEENRDLPKCQKKKKLRIVQKKLMSVKKQLLKVLLLTNPCTYKREDGNTYPIAEGNGNKYAFYCIPSKRNIACHDMGLGDVKQHCRTLYHKTME